MVMTIDQENVDALLDGALDLIDSIELESKIAADPDALRALGESTLLNLTLKRVIRGCPGEIDMGIPAFDPVAAQPVANDNSPDLGKTFPAIVASFMVVTAGVAGFFGGQINDPVPARLEAALGSVQLAQAETLARALDQLKSGEMANWQDAKTGWRGEITPLRTFKSKDARWCREYRATNQLGKIENVRFGMACRTGEGEWRTELERLGES